MSDCDDYSNREIDAMVEKMHEMLTLILEQTTKTNGRVKSLEAWQNRIIGGMAVLSALVVPLVVYTISLFVG